MSDKTLMILDDDAPCATGFAGPWKAVVLMCSMQGLFLKVPK